MIRCFRRIPIALLTLGLGASAVWAQTRPPESPTPSVRGPSLSVPSGGQTTPIIIRSRGTRAPRVTTPQRSPVVPFTGTQKLDLAKVGLAILGQTATGVGHGIRLTATELNMKDRAFLRLRNALHVDPDLPRIKVYPTFLPPFSKTMDDKLWSSFGLDVWFRPSVAGQPLLLDIALDLGGIIDGKVLEFRLKGSGIEQALLLKKATHHVTAIVIPDNTYWHSVELRTLVRDDQVGDFMVDYVEITPIN